MLQQIAIGIPILHHRRHDRHLVSVGVRDKLAGTMKLYVNGALQATTTYTGGWASNGNLAVGRAKWTNSADWFNGVVDEVQVFAGALTAAEVSALFTNP